ncbi:MAG TPA: Na+/H+ antiporter subunit E [Gemmatimonadaceae bacterium]|nr:Na+/H+ antiporter subunit E [Gemmatimonadaceae bacterium]
MITARRVRAAISLVAVFVYDIVASSVAVARVVLTPNSRPHPAIVVIPVDARTDWGVALFAYLVSLTPGSTCLHVADDRRSLYVHLLDAPDIPERVAEIKALYERWILQLEGEEATS